MIKIWVQTQGVILGPPLPVQTKSDSFLLKSSPEVLGFFNPSLRRLFLNRGGSDHHTALCLNLI